MKEALRRARSEEERSAGGACLGATCFSREWTLSRDPADCSRPAPQQVAALPAARAGGRRRTCARRALSAQIHERSVRIRRCSLPHELLARSWPIEPRRISGFEGSLTEVRLAKCNHRDSVRSRSLAWKWPQKRPKLANLDSLTSFSAQTK